jgi:phage pi2 protein 07
MAGSADKTSKRYDRTDNTEETLQHPDFVKDVVVHEGFVYTACSDEDIRQWSLEVSSFSFYADNRQWKLRRFMKDISMR